MEQAGGRAVDVRENVLRPGDFLASSTNWKARLRVSPRAATLVDAFELPLPSVTTMMADSATGFYAIQWGPLPFRFLSGITERFEVRRLDRLVIFESEPREIERRARELRRAADSLAPLLALDALGWKNRSEPRSEDSTWLRCLPEFERLAAGVSGRCLWCATESQCADCVGAVARQVGLDESCARQLQSALRNQVTRCSAQLDDVAPADAACRELLAIRRQLTGELDP
jgi:hypothetical protein